MDRPQRFVDGSRAQGTLLSKNEPTNFLLNSEARHSRGRSDPGARRSGRAGSGKIGCQRNYLAREQNTFVSCKASTEERNQRMTTRLSPGREVFFVAGCRPVERHLLIPVSHLNSTQVREQTEGRNPQLTTGVSTMHDELTTFSFVYHLEFYKQGEKSSMLLAARNVFALIFLCQPFLCKACSNVCSKVRLVEFVSKNDRETKPAFDHRFIRG